ncbi:hypothetical protein L226DRAFT_612409 [Lentinus tigrinus ALCF2SS1-7]|uniref:RRM domain-containing protein n=1 Tax=Lentinus tigrinus ALCF2SS1-6 TaxID=1328759 RepID=A0A5C2SEC8_9APHY|nr:hypothetical protein L227DRAFT_523899 [Lentinus tigrinus ALCF2SS1-6]RPD76191.1 hypothetical protein L226DRAFT_612409 [Lentinus tigrinus ALCF2SS1-7]
MSKVVFVGNVPYNMAEDQLGDVFSSVGQVVGLRLVYDRETGKPKGYGFCEFADHETALSAMRNLNGQEIGGRPLRIDLADSDPFLEGKTTVRGEIVDGGSETRAQWRERNERERSSHDRDRDYDRHGRRDDSNSFLANLPKGVALPPGTNASDAITNVLATSDPSQILEVLAQMKAFVITHPEHARALLVAHPQLGYALFQALLLNKIVDSGVLNRMLAAAGVTVPPAAPTSAPVPASVPTSVLQTQPAPPPYLSAPVPPLNQPQPSMYQPAIPPPSHTPVHHPTPPIPPANMYGQPPPQMPPPYYRPPPQQPQPQAVPPHPQQAPPPPMPSQPMHVPPPQMQAPPPQMQVPPPQAVAPPPAGSMPGFDEAQRNMLMQVLQLTPEQLNSLPLKEREQIMQLRRQFGLA